MCRTRTTVCQPLDTLSGKADSEVISNLACWTSLVGLLVISFPKSNNEQHWQQKRNQSLIDVNIRQYRRIVYISAGWTANQASDDSSCIAWHNQLFWWPATDQLDTYWRNPQRRGCGRISIFYVDVCCLDCHIYLSKCWQWTRWSNLVCTLFCSQYSTSSFSKRKNETNRNRL